MSPVVDGDLVIVSAAVSNWGSAAGRAHRFIALNKRTGDVVYVSNPGGRPYDTAYAPPIIATINGMRLLIAGLGDGGIHAIKAQTGEKVWSFPAAKRAINTGVAVSGNTVFVSHGDENLEGVELGLVAALDGSQTGDIKTTKWAVKGIEFGYSSPLRRRHTSVSDRQRLDAERLRHRDRQEAVDAAAGLGAEGVAGARRRQALCRHRRRRRSSSSGPAADKAEILSKVELPNSTNSCCGSEGTPEQILGNAAISRGRIFFMSSDAIYAIGSRRATSPTGLRARRACAGRARPAGASAGVAHRIESRSRPVGHAPRAPLRRARPLHS